MSLQAGQASAGCPERVWNCAGEGSPRQALGAAPDAANPTFSSLPVGYDPSTYATQNYILNIIGQGLIPFTYSKKVACLDAVDDRIQAYPHSSVLVEIAVRPAAAGPLAQSPHPGSMGCSVPTA